MITLQELLLMKVPAKDKDGNDITISPEFCMKVQPGYLDDDSPNDEVHVIVHAVGHSSDTLDFIVKGNELIPLN